MLIDHYYETGYNSAAMKIPKQTRYLSLQKSYFY